jgi:hypothetical protein
MVGGGSSGTERVKPESKLSRDGADVEAGAGAVVGSERVVERGSGVIGVGDTTVTGGGGGDSASSSYSITTGGGGSGGNFATWLSR